MSAKKNFLNNKSNLLIIFIIILSIFLNFYLLLKWNQKNLYIKNLHVEKLRLKKIYNEEFAAAYKEKKNHNYFHFSEDSIFSENKKKYLLKKFKTNIRISINPGKGISSAYLFNNKERYFLVSSSGKILSIIKNELYKTSKFKFHETNLVELINDELFYQTSTVGIRGVYFDEKKEDIYLSYNNKKNDNCYNISVLKGNFNKEKIIFKNFFDPPECYSDKKFKYNNFSTGQSGGRIQNFNEEKILLTIGSHGGLGEVQKNNFLVGKTVLISKNNGKDYQVFTKGHRNPQGLYINSEKLIISTEHGPQGGDEINIINKNKNYGWPLASYGHHYSGANKKINQLFPLPKEHGKDFNSPAFYFKNSIAISNLVEVDEKFNGYKSYFVASMKKNKEYGDQINLYEFSKNKNKFILKDYLPIGERIRDLTYDKENKVIMLFLEESSSILFIKYNE